jgi:hypothetical protein
MENIKAYYHCPRLWRNIYIFDYIPLRDAEIEVESLPASINFENDWLSYAVKDVYF